MMGRMLVEIEIVFVKYKFDCVFVYGDINFILVGVLVVFKLYVLVVYVEVGLCSFNM